MVKRKATAINYRHRSGATKIEAEQKQMETLSVIAILREKWAAVMAKDQAGYFAHEWQELRNQVRRTRRIARAFPTPPCLCHPAVISTGPAL
ncbi:MAG: hypothetical protein ACXWMH_10815 [Syntrophales bacterium]